MENFILRKWELPLDCTAPLVAPADAVGEIEWRGRTTEVIIRTVKIERGVWWVFFQPRDEPLSNYSVMRATSWPIKPESWETRKTAPELSRIVRMASEGQQFHSARFFYLGEPQNATAFFYVADFSWVGGDWIDERESAISFKMRAATRAWDSPRLYQWLLKKWRKPDSEVRFAWQWSQWSEEYRHQWLYNEARGLNELVQVMEWALQSEPTLQNSVTSSWYLDAKSRLDDPSDTDRFRCADVPWENLDMRQTSPRLWALRQFFVAHFLPLPPLRIIKPPLCVQSFDRLHHSHIMAQREIQTSEQQREAALNLRTWLQKNDAPAELLALL